MSEPTPGRRAVRRWPALIAALAVFLAFAGALYAATIVIDPDDGSVAEWAAQGIPVFQADPSGDTPIATDDLVDASVATGDIAQPSGNIPGLAFRAQVAAPPAASQLGRAVVAMLDCDRNGLDNERQDRWAVYNTTGPRTDEVTLYTGDQYYGLIPSVYPKFLGQRVLGQLEWAIPISDLPIRGDEPPELGKVVDCRHKVNIRIATMQFVTPTGFLVLDTLTPSLGWDIETGKPLSATLSISIPPDSPADLALDWNATAQSPWYNVQRSSESPYSGYQSLATVESPGLLDVGAAVDAEDDYYYQVQGTSGEVSVDPSNIVGASKFRLVPGDPPSP
jgi:hypothetical protein